VTETQDQLDVLPGAEPAASGARKSTRNSASGAAEARAKRRSGSLSTMLLPELQALASSMGIAAGKMRKSDLVAAIEAGNRPQAAVKAPSGNARTTDASASSAAAAPPAAASTTRPRRAASRAAGPAQTSFADETTVAPQAATASEPLAQTRLSAEPAQDDGRNNDGRQQADRQQPDRGERPASSNRNRDSQNVREGASQSNREPQGNRDAQGNQGRSQGGRDGQGQSNRDGARDGQNRNQNNTNQNSSNQNSQNRNDEDEDFSGGSRRGRRYRDRRGRTRDRFDSPTGGGRQEAEPTISDDDVLVPVAGILDSVEDKNTWFIRTGGYFASPEDVYVANSHVRRYGLRRGDAVTGMVKQPRDGERKEKFNPLVRLDTVNGVDPEQARNRVEFTKLTPLYPQDRLRLETEPHILTTRVIDLVMPIGKGQRALIVSPPKAGKTSVLQAIANAIAVNNPECHLMVVLVDERPEEVTDMQRSVKGEVIASTFDRRPQDHTMIAELSIERAKRLVEMGHDVVVLLDSITRLGRAYNLAAPASGRILSGGVDSTALYPPKRFLGAARNIEDGGSLTIIATALVETGSTMDTVIFEEFKGTGNAELKLDRKIADKRVFPAIDVDQSGTRKEEILLPPDELSVVIKLRRVLHALEPQQGIDLLLDRLKKSRTNIEFLMQIAKTAPGGDDR
jgi:transcription termination factor Rho